MPMPTRTAWWWWLTTWSLAGCNVSEDPPTPPPPAGGTSGETDSGPGPTTLSGSAGDGDGDGDDDAARCFETPPVDPTEGGTDTGTTSGAKLDVGPDGDGPRPVFPPTCEEVAEDNTNLGCEFWAVDLPNEWRGTTRSPPAADQQFAVVVANSSANVNADIQVFLGDANEPLQRQFVSPDETWEFRLDSQSIRGDANSGDGIAYRIVSDVPITAYQFNPLDNTVEVYSNDASLLYPSHVLTTDYTAITGSAILLSTGSSDTMPVLAGAFVSVVALEDDTDIDIYPTAGLNEGPTEGVRIQRGSVHTFISDGESDDGNLSGSRVVANKPVAVFAGNVATVEPVAGEKCCADHIEHQMAPLPAWGTEYVAFPPPATVGSGNDSAVYRMTGSFDVTWLEYCPFRPEGAPRFLDRYQTVEFQVDHSFVVSAAEPDKPFAVTQFLQSNGTLNEQEIGDPAMIPLPATAQYEDKYVFAVPEGYAQNYVTVVRRGRGEIRLDGRAIDGQSFRDAGVLGGEMHSYAHVAVESGAHTVEGDTQFSVRVVGYDEAVSYGFPGGMGLDVIAPVPPVG